MNFVVHCLFEQTIKLKFVNIREKTQIKALIDVSEALKNSFKPVEILLFFL